MLSVHVEHRSTGRTNFRLFPKDNEIAVRKQDFGATLDMSDREAISAICFLDHNQMVSIRDQLNGLLDPPDQTIPHPTTEELAECTPLVEDSSGA
jgi:hypothetical protein